MKRTHKALVALPLALAMLFVSNGVASNVVYHAVEEDMFNSVTRSAKSDNSLMRFSVGELTGYIAASDYSSPRHTIIYFGGAGEIAYNAVLKYKDAFKDFVFICVDYPGTQDSGGDFSIKDMQKAASAVFDFVLKLKFVDTAHIYSVGYSYGTGMATFLASERNCAGLVLVSPYRDTADIVKSKLKIPSIFFRAFITGNIKTKSYAEDVSEPTLIITSDADEVFSTKIARSLAGSFKYARVSEFSGLSHPEYLGNLSVINEITAFCGG